MQTSTVLLVLVALTLASFALGNWRSQLVAAGAGGVRALHSLPRHYGYMAALWAALPALAVLVIWVGLEGRVLNSLVVAELPPEVRALPDSELGLYYNQIVSYARGSSDAALLDETQVAAAGHYASLLGDSRMLKALLVSLVAIVGCLLAVQRVTPSLRARNHVEKIYTGILFTCSFIAVLTTLGIVLSVLFEAMRFFRAIPMRK